MYLLTRQRMMWGEGRLGGGKTSFAFRMAYELVKREHVRYIVSNVDSVWNTPLEKVEPRGQYLDTVVVLDEAGLMVRNQRDADEIAVFLRKLNVIVLMPSVQAPARATRALTALRTHNLMSLGLPFWRYRGVLLAGSQRDMFQKEIFLWYKPTEIFGLYDTESMPFDDDGISGWLSDHIERHKKDSGKRTNLQITRKRAAMVDVGGFLDDIQETAETIADAVPVPEQRSRGRNKK
jgi:hypothetical protein